VALDQHLELADQAGVLTQRELCLDAQLDCGQV
jgi:hypothetical protein